MECVLTKIFEIFSLHFSIADLKCRFTKICEIFSLYSPMDIKRPFGKNFVKLFEKIFSSLTNGHEEVVLAEVSQNFSFTSPSRKRRAIFQKTEQIFFE